MRKIAFFLLLTLVLAACSVQQTHDATQATTAGPTPAGDSVLVEIISLDHAPIRPTVQEVKDAAAEFGDKVTVQSYNFDTPEGTAFAEAHDLTEHTPIAIFVNGQMDYKVDGRSVQFYSFPQNAGTGMVAEGVWTMDDLRAVLEQETN